MKVLHFFMIFLLLFLISCDDDSNKEKDFMDSDIVDSDSSIIDEDVVDADGSYVDEDVVDADESYVDEDVVDPDEDLVDSDFVDEDIPDEDIPVIEMGENGCYNISVELLGSSKFVLKTTDYGSGVSFSVLEKEIAPIFWTDNKEDKFVIEFWEKTEVGTYDLTSMINSSYEDAMQRVALYNSEDNCDGLTGTDFDDCVDSADYFLFQRNGTLEVLEGDSFNENLFIGRITGLILYDVVDPAGDDSVVEPLDGSSCYNFPTIEWTIRKTETFDCSTCGDWEECNAEETACVVKDGMCGEDADCSQNSNNITDCDMVSHNCIFDCFICASNQTCDLENEQCVKIDYCESDPCAGNSDSGKTKCSDLESSYLCGCEDGYYFNDTVCVVEDACNPVNPCTEENKGVCTVNSGSAVCSCDAGFVDNGSGKCVAGSEPACAANLSEITIGTDLINEETIESENYYNPKGYGCLESNGAPGNDVIYKFKLNANKTIKISLEDPNYNGSDYSIYILDTCESTYKCFVGADDDSSGYGVEEISFTASETGTYYLVVDQFMQNNDLYSFTIVTSVE